MTTPPFPRMPWYPRDFASSTRGWPLVARGVYRELLDCQWDAGGSGVGTLPDDEEHLQRLAGATAGEWRVAWPYIKLKLPKVKGGRRNGRLEHHRAVAVREFEARRRGAAATNLKRYGDRSASRARVANETPSEPTASRDRAFVRVATTTTTTEDEEVRVLRRGEGN
jgi:uncharacterized protein YdaU (DUF1376 family)